MNVGLGSKSEFHFEYSDQKFVLKLFLVCFACFILLVFSMFKMSEAIGFLPSFLVLFGIPGLIFYLHSKKAKKIGEAFVDNESLQLMLENEEKNIRFSELANYKVEHYHGTVLSLKFKDGTKFKLTANDNFCDSHPFEILCNQFEKELTNFNKSENGREEIIRKKSFFEQKWVLYFLVIMSISIVLAIYYIYTSGKSTPATIFSSAGIIITMWAAYLKNLSKRSKS